MDASSSFRPTQSPDSVRRGLAFIRQHPLQWAKLLIKKPYYLYENDEQGLWFSFVKEGEERPAVARWLYALWVKPSYAYYGAVMLLACLGAWYALKLANREPGAAISVVLIPTLLLTLFYVLFHTENRYNHTIMPLVAIAAAYGLCRVVSALASKEVRAEISQT